MAKEAKTRIISNRRISPDTFLIAVDLPPYEIEPFQFVMVRVPGRNDLSLRRPLGVFTYEDTSYLLIKAVGEGTRAICDSEPGTEFLVTGPFGSPDCPKLLHSYKKVTLVMGGIGAAGVLQFAMQYPERMDGVFFGSTTIWDTPFYETLQSIASGKTLAFSTDDGTFAHHGLITDLFEKHCNLDFCDAVLTCGPIHMLKAVHDIAVRTGIPCFVSLEARMACGLGACRGCAVPVIPNYCRGKEYYMVCDDGPLFNSLIIDWERLGE